MKKILCLTAGLLLLLAFSVHAQQRGTRGTREQLTPEQQATRVVERLTKELQLTEQQQTTLKTWYTASFKNRKEIMEKNRDDRQAIREKMQKEREANEAQLKKVLTSEQYKTYQANEAKRRQELQQRRGRQGGQFPKGQQR